MLLMLLSLHAAKQDYSTHLWAVRPPHFSNSSSSGRRLQHQQWLRYTHKHTNCQEAKKYASLVRTGWVVVVCWLLNVPATCECISGMDLLRQFYVMPHWDRSCRPNFPPHPVTVYWHRADQSQHWPSNTWCLAGANGTQTWDLSLSRRMP